MSREEGLYKDKIEVSLDGRQIFYLFFGGSVIVGLVFVLGVMVGRRVEARGHVERAQTQTAVDPLAALDRLEGGGGLSFQGALRGGDVPANDVENKIGELAKQNAKKPDAKAKAPEVKKDEPKLEAKAEPKDEKKPEKKDEPKAEPKAEKKDEPKAEKKDDKKLEAKVDAMPKAEAKPEKKDEPKKSKFALQLSSFQDKGEAQAYLEQVKSNGLPAYVTEAEIDGKTYYRVRVGKYASIDAASDAKVDIDKATKKSATVVKL
jgi:cell division septation protein DedD